MPAGGGALYSLRDEVVALVRLLEEGVATVDILAVVAPGHARCEPLAARNEDWRLDDFDQAQAVHELKCLVEGRRSAVLARHLDAAVGTECFYARHAAGEAVLCCVHQSQVRVIGVL